MRDEITHVDGVNLIKHHVIGMCVSRLGSSAPAGHKCTAAQLRTAKENLDTWAEVNANQMNPEDGIDALDPLTMAHAMLLHEVGGKTNLLQVLRQCMVKLIGGTGTVGAAAGHTAMKMFEKHIKGLYEEDGGANAATGA